MKRIIVAIIALLTLIVGFAQLQDVLPVSLQHFMDERANISRLMKTNRQEAQVLKDQSCYAPSYMRNGVEMVDAFICYEDASVLAELKRLGVLINCEFDGFVTANIPVAELTTVARTPGVTAVEISKLMDLATDSTLSVTHAGEVIHGTEFGLSQAYDGTGVIIGIIDTGFDYQHLAFRCASDTSRCRIVRVYDPVDSTGHEVRLGTNVLPGTVFIDNEIDTLISDGTGTHGTHTASIAAGMHVNGYGGMAPGADIVLCCSRNLNMRLSETEVVNCLKYIYSYADSVGKPCVISVSVSTVDGSHDGQDMLSKAVASSVGPGRVFVIAAGNNSGKQLYCHGPATEDKPFNMLLGCTVSNLSTDRSYYYGNIWYDTWVRNKSARSLVKFHILDKQTQRIVWESSLISLYKKVDSSEFSEFYGPDESVDNTGYLAALVAQSAIAGKYEIQIYVYNLKSKDYYIDSQGVYNSRYAIGASFYPPSLMYHNQTDCCYIDSWACTGVRIAYYNPIYKDVITEEGDTITEEITGFYGNPTDDGSIGTYAVNDSVISVGAFVGRNSYYSLNRDALMVDNQEVGSLYYVSGFETAGVGPTGSALPTVTAPGFDVVAAGSRYSYMLNPGYPGLVMRTDDGSVWGVMSGTSMAAPTVAGIIAQWLQVNPTLSPGEIKNVIEQTAIKDSYTAGSVWGPRFGPNGKIDAMAGVRYLLSLVEDEILLGDVNGNGEINITDLSLLIHYVLDNSSGDIVVANADFNQDGVINITDVSLLILFVLNSPE